MDKRDFLFEIGTEELPAQGLSTLAEHLAQLIRAGLQQAQLSYSDTRLYITPRRFAILVYDLAEFQPAIQHTRKGPAWQAAYDEKGQPTTATLGFAKSCRTEVEKLEKLENEQGVWLFYRYTEPGKRVSELLPNIIQQAMLNIAHYRTMRWGNHDFTFIRPVHWVVMLYGNEIINCELFGLKANHITYGHRFHAPQAIQISTAQEYVSLLKNQGKVIADCAERRQSIQTQIHTRAAQIKGAAIIPDALLDEVTGLVEWPCALLGSFAPEFLTIPKEALISSMQNHQKSFAVIDAQQQLLPYFITISNIESSVPQTVVLGNEKVIHARLSDAAFFYQLDCSHGLNHFISGLKQLIFQKQLGTVYDKCLRIATLAEHIATLTGADAKVAKQAGRLAKADLLSNMVNEFPELQGIMGSYYALAQGEDPSVAKAIAEQYLPRNNQDDLPQTGPGLALALADRIDTLLGLFGIGQPPTGDKDPFALRRAALGIILIVIKCRLNIDLKACLSYAWEHYTPRIANPEAADQVFQFILERMPAYLQEQGIAYDTLTAVAACQSNSIYDIYQRALALQQFRQSPETSDLIAANKRIKNILMKETIEEVKKTVQTKYLQHPAEKHLATLQHNLSQMILQKALNNRLQEHQIDYWRDYADILIELAKLAMPLNDFFANVLVLCDDQAIRQNRLGLLNSLRDIFLSVADLSLLQG